MYKPRPAALAASLALLGVLFIAACTSHGHPPEDARRGPSGPPMDDLGQRAALPVSLSGGQVARPVALLFAGMDRDGNHVIDSGELAAGILAEWEALPVSARETVPALAIVDWATGSLGHAEALPNQIAFDVNLDGQVSADEFATRLHAEFAALDRDHDGRLTHAEMLVELPSRGDGLQRAGMRGPGGLGGPAGGSRPPRLG